jgi:hypothetical protein
MEFKHTLEVLYTQAEEIRNLAAKLEEADEIRVIELDLLLEKLRNIYDLILDLEASVPAGRKEQINSQVSKTERQLSDTTPLKPVEDKPADTEIRVVEKKEKPVREETAVPDKPKKGPVQPEKKFVSDRFKGSKQTLHEEMAGRTKPEDISSQYKAKPINNIMGAIALNDRFELINQLFGGDKVLFERTIEVLNMAGSFVEAYTYLQENFKWDMDNEYVQRILELIRRKLIVHRNE